MRLGENALSPNGIALRLSRITLSVGGIGLRLRDIGRSLGETIVRIGEIGLQPGGIPSSLFEAEVYLVGGWADDSHADK